MRHRQANFEYWLNEMPSCMIFPITCWCQAEQSSCWVFLTEMGYINNVELGPIIKRYLTYTKITCMKSHPFIAHSYCHNYSCKQPHGLICKIATLIDHIYVRRILSAGTRLLLNHDQYDNVVDNGSIYGTIISPAKLCNYFSPVIKDEILRQNEDKEKAMLCWHIL